jgi:hypothetical protein
LVADFSENLPVSIFMARLKKLRCLINSLIGGGPTVKHDEFKNV